MSAWRQIVYGFIGNFIFALFAAICAVLGFGPNQWAEYLISGMPLLITPQVLRLNLSFACFSFSCAPAWRNNNFIRKSQAHSLYWRHLFAIRY
jgi:hypothetical protein